MSAPEKTSSPLPRHRAAATVCLTIGLTACAVDDPRRTDGGATSRTSPALGSDGGRIAGSVWDDADGDGRLDRHEEGLRGVRVYLDSDDDGVLDAGERATRTDGRGRYELRGLADGVYNVRQEVPFGWRNTAGGEGPVVTPIAIQDTPGANIIGGTETTIDEYPFMVAVGFLFDGTFFQFCGGSLISDRWVATAAHCTEGLDPEIAGVLVGTHDVNDGSGQVFAVRALHIHPDYVPTPEEPTDEPFSVFAGFDIALWELAAPVDLAASDLNSVEMLPAGTRRDRTGTLATTIGWGVSDLDSDLLQEVHLPIFDQEACHAVYFDSINFETQICAGAPEGGVDACQGDSGGPMLVRSRDDKEWLLSGITSYGNGCALPGNPGVWARVSQLSGWAEATAREPSRVHRVEVRAGGTEQADFGDRSTLRPERERIDPRWQLINLTAEPEAGRLALSWRIVDEARRPRSYDCSFDLDGPGPGSIAPLPCAEGLNQADVPAATEGVYLPEFVAARTDVDESFRRSSTLLVGEPPVSSAEGALTEDDPTDPDFPGTTFFIDYFDLAGLSAQKAIIVRVTTSDFFPLVGLYDRDLREAGDPAAFLEFFGFEFNDDGSFTAVLAFFPDPAIRYVVGVSTFGEAETGSYLVEMVNEGQPVATTIEIPPASAHTRRLRHRSGTMIEIPAARP